MNANFSVDSFLASLPPPPEIAVRKKRGPTRSTFFPEKEEKFAFVGEPSVPKAPKPVNYSPKNNVQEKKKLVDPKLDIDTESENESTENTKPVMRNAKNSCNPGVFYKIDKSETKIQVKRVPVTQVNAKNKIVYPETFKSRCWWCCTNFKTRPIGIPHKYFPKKRRFHCFGFFCSFECAYAFSQERSQHSRGKVFSGQLLLILRKQLLNVKLAEPLLKAPHFTNLKSFGGHLTISQFRKQAKTIRSTSIPETISVIPFGFSVFEKTLSSKRRRVQPNKRARPIDSEIRKLAPVSKSRKLRTINKNIKNFKKKQNLQNSLRKNARGKKFTVPTIKSIGRLVKFKRTTLSFHENV